MDKINLTTKQTSNAGTCNNEIKNKSTGNNSKKRQHIVIIEVTTK